MHNLALSVHSLISNNSISSNSSQHYLSQLMADGENSSLVPKLIICLIASALAVVVVTAYHCITARRMLLLRRGPPQSPEALPHQQTVSTDNSMAELLPAHKFRKGEVGLIGVDNGMCAICLSEFEEGEELRTMPECVHSFHAMCIDMWLYSHSNCPMCRADVGLEESSSSPTTLMHLMRPINIPQGPSIALLQLNIL